MYKNGYLAPYVVGVVAFRMWVRCTLRGRGSCGYKYGYIAPCEVQIATAEFVVGLDSVLRWTKLTLPCLRPVKDVFHLKYIMLNSVVFYACDMIQTLAAVFCVIRAVNKFTCRLV